MAVDLQMPAGFRFHPTDEELVIHYLCKKCANQPIAVPIIAEIDLYKYDPWHLPGLALYGEKEWYFFSPRDRKYPNGSRPNRAAGRGYWKATGADKPIGHPKPIGIKKALVFYAGKAPKGEKTNWIMHEYRLADVDRSARKKGNSLRLDDWVLCRLYNKKGTLEKHQSPANQNVPSEMVAEDEDKKPLILTSLPETGYTDLLYLDPADSIPRLHTDSSCSEHVLSPEFSVNTSEVQSERKLNHWDRFALEFQFNYMDAPTLDNDNVFLGPDMRGPMGPQYLGNSRMESVQDVMCYMHKPF